MEKLRNIGLKLTPQRMAILEYLKDNKEHPSADDIYRAVAKKFPTMSFATVYNTLETLRKHSRLIELSVDPEKKRFDPNTAPHHHLMCVKCKKIVDIHSNYRLNITEDEKSDFEIIGNHIEFYGICPKCKANGGGE
jgi:Fur family peroxide stress response transcriptional regulator